MIPIQRRKIINKHGILYYIFACLFGDHFGMSLKKFNNREMLIFHIYSVLVSKVIYAKEEKEEGGNERGKRGKERYERGENGEE